MKILYFAWLRARVGAGEETRERPAGVETVGQLIDWLAEQSPGHAEAFARRGLVRAAVNQDFAGLDHAIADGDEIAFFPPVTGG